MLRNIDHKKNRAKTAKIFKRSYKSKFNVKSEFFSFLKDFPKLALHETNIKKLSLKDDIRITREAELEVEAKKIELIIKESQKESAINQISELLKEQKDTLDVILMSVEKISSSDVTPEKFFFIEELKKDIKRRIKMHTDYSLEESRKYMEELLLATTSDKVKLYELALKAMIR